MYNVVHMKKITLYVSLVSVLLLGYFGTAQAATLYNLDNDPAVARLAGQNANGLVGSDVASMGDVDGDGYDDFVVGESYGESEDGYGRFHLIYGTAAGYSNGVLPTVADATFIGFSNSDRLGDAMDRAGDVNGDGYADILVGSPGIENGAAYLLYGSATRFSGSANIEDAADVIFREDITVNFLGEDVSGVGDLDGDGYDDLIIAHKSGNNGSTGLAGAIFIFYGGTQLTGTLTPSTDADAIIRGTSQWEYFGVAVSRTNADFNNDGLNDFLVGANPAGENDSVAYLFYGSATRLAGELETNAASAAFALNWETGGLSDVDAIGDLNGDTYTDFVLGSYNAQVSGTEQGSAYVFMGQAAAYSGTYDVESDATAELQGQYPEAWYGIFVSGINDLNGDGYDELMVASRYGAESSGNTYLFYGDANMYSGVLNGPATAQVAMSNNNGFLNAMGESGGDVNGDGYQDLLVRVPLRDGAEGDSGAIYIVQGDNEPIVGLSNELLGIIESDPSGLIRVEISDGDVLSFDVFPEATEAPVATVLANKQLVSAIGSNGRQLKVVNRNGKVVATKAVLKLRRAKEVRLVALDVGGVNKGQEIVVGTRRGKTMTVTLFQYLPLKRKLVRRNQLQHEEPGAKEKVAYVTNDNEIQFADSGMDVIHATYVIENNQLVKSE